MAYFKSSSTFDKTDNGVGFKNIPTRLECGNEAQPKPFKMEAMNIPSRLVIIVGRWACPPTAQVEWGPFGAQMAVKWPIYGYN